MNKEKSILIATNPQKILNFFLDCPGKEFTEKEVQNAAKSSKAGANYALKELSGAGFLFRNKRGKMSFYSLNYREPLIKQLKIVKVILCLKPVIRILRPFSSEIILFGSCSRGEGVLGSDIDIFVISNNKKQYLEKEIEKLRLKRKIQLVVETELSHTELKVKDLDFYEQVQRGIVLWKKA